MFVNIYNSQAVALSDGDLVCWNLTTPDGVKTTQPTTAGLGLIMGVADGAIAAGAYGLAQAYGYKSAILMTGDSTTAMAAGDAIIPVDQVDYAAWSTAGTGLSGFLYTAEVVASSAAAATYKGFIRCM